MQDQNRRGGRTLQARLLTAMIALAASAGGSAPLQAAVPMRPNTDRVLLPPPSEEALQIWRQAAVNPTDLLAYLVPLSQMREEPGRRQPIRQARSRRYWAIIRLGDVAGPTMVPALEARAEQINREEDWEPAAWLKSAIARIKARAGGRAAYIQEMMTWLRTPPSPTEESRADLEYRMKVIEAARALGLEGAREAVAPIEQLLSTPQWNGTRWGLFLVRALARFREPSTLPRLRAMVTNTLPGGYLPIERLPLEPGEPDPAVVYWELRTAGMTWEQKLAEIVRGMRDEYSSNRAAEYLRSLGRPVVSTLIRLLQEAPAGEYGQQARGHAARILADLQAVESIPAMATIASNEQEPTEIRRGVVDDLGWMNDPRASAILQQVLRSAQPVWVRSDAVSALERAKGPGYEGALIAALEDSAARIRAKAAEALGRVGTQASLEPLLQRAKKETDPVARERAAVARNQIARRLGLTLPPP